MVESIHVIVSTPLTWGPNSKLHNNKQSGGVKAQTSFTLLPY